MSKEKDQNFEELQALAKSKPNSLKSKYTNEQLAQIIIDNGQSKKTLSTLKCYDKNKLLKIVIDGEQEAKAPVKVSSSDNKSMADGIIETIEEVKESIHGSKLNKFVKKKVTNTLRNILDKFTIENDDLTENLGWFGNAMSFVMLAIDVFVGFEKVPGKIKDFKEKRSQGKVNENQKKQ